MHGMWPLVLTPLLLAGGAWAQFYQFCDTGIPAAGFADDGGSPSIEVILAQAPLFSTNPKFGQKAKYLSMFHTALVFAQRGGAGGDGARMRYWTLEYDFTGASVLTGTMPRINGSNLNWITDARFCLSDGLLWGMEHWTKSFDTVFRITAAQANRTFRELVLPVNSSLSNHSPQYQLWRVAQAVPLLDRPRRTLVPDITCTDGAKWVLHYIATTLGVAPRSGFKLRGTVVVVPARRIEPVDTENAAQWKDIVTYYSHLVELSSKVGSLEKLFDVLRLVPAHYVYDTNARTYYRVVGNWFPFMHSKFLVFPLSGPPLAGAAAVEQAEAEEDAGLGAADLEDFLLEHILEEHGKVVGDPAADSAPVAGPIITI